MSTVLTLVGCVVLVAGMVGVVKGGVQRVGLAGRKQSAWAAAGAVAVLAAGSALAPTPARPPATESRSEMPAPAQHIPESVPSAPPTAEVVTQSRPERQPTVAPGRQSAALLTLGPLLVTAPGGDGDSWHDTGGIEYRMGLVNAPEVNECGGSAATAYRKRELAAGFFARSYSTDNYGRRVSVIYTRNGSNLNVLMARTGIANDKYLSEFRHENPALAQELDAAFGHAKASRVGVWGSCSSGGSATSVQPAPRPQALVGSAGGCQPDYRTCVPIQGDGSGRGAANDLDCGDIGTVVYLRVVGRDPYRLDANADGVGCESYG